jgi:hypothetical protein
MTDSANLDRSSGPIDPRDRIGLCENCRHVRVVSNTRGSVFYMCQLSEIDPRFSKYPRLPVIQCAGYESKEDQAS